MDGLKTFRNMVVALVCALLAFACNNEDDSGLLPAGEYPMTFSTSVEQQLTRSSISNTWDGGEEVAIQTSGTIKKYIAAASGKISVANGLEPFYWQSQSETKTVQGWYPYRELGNDYLEVQQDQSGAGYQASDLLFAPPTDITFSGRESTPLKFYHQTAKVIINITKAEAATNTSDIASVKLGDAYIALSGGYVAPTSNATQGTWSRLSTYVKNLIPKEFTPTGTALRSYEALVIPQDMTGKKFIAVTLTNGNTYYYIPTGTDGVLEGGKAHTYNITVNRTGITVSVGDIDDWTGTGDPTIEGGAGIWKVGDYYPDPNADLNNPTEKAKIKGVVFWVDPSDSRHGKVVGLQENSYVTWSVSSGITPATDMANGRANMRTLYDLNANFSDYPAFAWVHSLNDANEDYGDAGATGVWYLPGKNELKALYAGYSGKVYETINGWGDYVYMPGYDDLLAQDARSVFNARLTAAGGTVLSNNWYWSSSDHNLEFAWSVDFGEGGPPFGSNKINNSDKARCVLAF